MRMPLVGPRRTVLGGACLVLLSVAVGGQPRDGQAGPPDELVDAFAGQGTGPVQDIGIAEDGFAQWGPPADEAGPGGGGPAAEGVDASSGTGDGAAAEVEAGPLRGRAGAATALAVRDWATALALVEAEPAPAEGSPAWFVHGALRGRALRLSGRAGEAVAELAPRLAR
jgi:hypothetical protein